MKWQPMPAKARLPSGTLVEVLCGQPEQKYGVRVIGATACIWVARRPLNQSALARSMAAISGLRLRRSSRSRSEEHTSELQSRQYLVCRLLLVKKKKNE